MRTRIILLFALTLSLVTFGQNVFADKVTPSDRVTSFVKVRTSPTDDKGKNSGKTLEKGKTAELIGERPHWFHIRLDDGFEGFVSKGWSRVIPKQKGPTPPDLEIHFIDIGQGDSTLVVCPNKKTILVDSGSLPPVRIDTVRDYILRKLDRHERKIDTLVITHPDRDHYNLLPDVLHQIPITRLLMVGEQLDYSSRFQKWLRVNSDPNNSQALIKKITVLDSNTFTPSQSSSKLIDCGDAKVYILAAGIQAKASRRNAMSIVLMFRHGNIEAILTGDATKDTEQRIMERYSPDWLDADILKVSPHGSVRTSLNSTWSEIVKPEIAIISASPFKKYSHPRKEVIERLESFTKEWDGHVMKYFVKNEDGYKLETVPQYDEAIFSMAASGNVAISSNGQSYEVTFPPFGDDDGVVPFEIAESGVILPITGSPSSLVPRPMDRNSAQPFPVEAGATSTQVPISTPLFMYLIAGVIFVAGVIGGMVEFFHFKDRTVTAKPRGKTLAISILMGMVAAFLVPLFLAMISSNLISDIGKRAFNYKSFINLLILFGFCLLASMYSRSLIRVVSDRWRRNERDVPETQTNTILMKFQAAQKSEEFRGSMLAIPVELPEGTTMESLASDYDRIQGRENLSPDNLNQCQHVVRQMLTLAPNILKTTNSYKVAEELNDSESVGRRIGAYAFLYVNPSSQYVETIIDNLSKDIDDPFAQYWALLALNQSVDGAEDIDESHWKKFRNYYGQLEPGSPRYHEASQIMKYQDKDNPDVII